MYRITVLTMLTVNYFLLKKKNKKRKRLLDVTNSEKLHLFFWTSISYSSASAALYF